MKTSPGKMYVFIGVFVALVHIIPITFYFSEYIGPWVTRPLLAQGRPSKDLHRAPITNTRVSPEIALETIRGGRHTDYASIVFQFSERIAFEEPSIRGNELRLLLRNVSTRLPPFRRYRTFDSWVTLEAVEEGLSVGIGLPEGYSNTRTLLLDAPHRLVVNIYDATGSGPPPEARISAPRLRVVSHAESNPLISTGEGDASIVITKTQFPGKDAAQDGIVDNGLKEAADEVPPGDQASGDAGEINGGSMQGSGNGSGIGPAGGGVGSPSSRYRIRITPKISIKEEYDDNIFLYKNNKKGDFITTISPGLLMYMDSGRNGLELEYTFGWVRYKDLSENDFVRHSGRLKFWQRFSRRLTFNVSDSYIKSNDLFDEDLAPDLRTQRIRHTATPYQRNDFDTNLEYRFGPKSRVSVGYRNGYLDNDDPDLEDIVEHSPYASLSYWPNNKDGFEVGYKYRRYDYSLGRDYSPGSVDLDAQDVDVAYTHRFGRRAAIHARYGFANRNFKGIPVAYHVNDVGLGVEYSFSPSMNLALDIGYFRPTGIDINPGLEYTGRFEKRFRRGRAYISARSGWDEGFMDVEPRAFTRYWGGDAGIEYEPVQDIQAYAGLDYRKNDYALQEQDDDDTVGGRFGIRYRFLRWFHADLGYAHRRRISDDPNNEYGDNRVTFTFTVSKPHPYHWEF